MMKTRNESNQVHGIFSEKDRLSSKQKRDDHGGTVLSAIIDDSDLRASPGQRSKKSVHKFCATLVQYFLHKTLRSELLFNIIYHRRGNNIFAHRGSRCAFGEVDAIQKGERMERNS